jgi:hypothetical protein
LYYRGRVAGGHSRLMRELLICRACWMGHFNNTFLGVFPL